MFNDTIQLKKWLSESYNILKTSKDLAKKTQDYYNGDQLEFEVLRELESRGQPIQWENNIKKIANKILGFKSDRNSEIKVHGRQNKDEVTAQILTDITRAIWDNNNYNEHKTNIDKDLMISGLCACDINVVNTDKRDFKNRSEKKILLHHIPSSDVYPDALCRSADGEDAKYLHVVKWVDKEDLFNLFGEVVNNISNNINFTNDYVQDELLTDDRNRVLLCYSWYKKFNKKTQKNESYYCFWSDTTIIKQGKSPYTFDGYPVKIQFLNKTKNGYFGLFKDLIPLQDNINFAKLRLFNILGSQKVLVQDEAVEDLEIFKEEFSLDSAIVGVNELSGIRELPQHSEINQLLQVIADARNQIKDILGFNDEALGLSDAGRLSGEAIQLRMRNGLAGLQPFLNSCDFFQKRVFKTVVKCIVQFYDFYKIMKIADKDVGLRYFEINGKDTKIKAGEYDFVLNMNVKPIVSSDERYRQNLELFKTMMNVDPNLAKIILPDLLRDSQSPSANKIELAIRQQMSQPQDQAQMQQLQLQMQEQQLKIAKLESEIRLNQAKTQHTTTVQQTELAKEQIRQQTSLEDIAQKDRRAEALMLTGISKNGK
jgi:hypothetical protein